MKKLWKRAGETVAETLVAVMIISMVFLFLAGAIVTAQRINTGIKPDEQAFRQDSADPTYNYIVKLNGTVVRVTLYQTENGYWYYEKE